jgi:hypothetical protein
MNDLIFEKQKLGLRSVKMWRAAARISFAMLVSAVCLLLQFGESQAAPFSADIKITGTSTFDTGFALALGSVSQTGAFSSTAGGLSTISNFNGTTVSGASPILGTLTNPGDGFGISADVDALSDSQFGIGIDIVIDITNQSAAIPYEVTFEVKFSNEVNSDGLDAIAESELTIDDPSGEVFFTQVVSDTLLGNVIDGVETGSFGGIVEDNGLSSFKILVDPLATLTIEAYSTQYGGAFDIDSAAEIDFASFISVQDVAAVPIPGTLLLLCSGMACLAAIRRQSKLRV